MKIKPLIGSESINDLHFKNDLEAFEKWIEIKLSNVDGKGKTWVFKNEKHKDITLEFQYFYSPSGSWKNAVWVCVNGNRNNWLYVHLNTNDSGRKVCLATAKNRKNVEYVQRLQPRYSLPPNFDSVPMFMEFLSVTKKLNIQGVFKEIKNRAVTF